MINDQEHGHDDDHETDDVNKQATTQTRNDMEPRTTKTGTQDKSENQRNNKHITKGQHKQTSKQANKQLTTKQTHRHNKQAR